MKNRWLEKISAVFLATILILCAVIGDMGIFVVWAAQDTTPGVTVYATKAQLMSDYMQDGTNETVGKIVFGKDYNGNALEWYILGKDNGVEGDNLSVFATSSIAIYKSFNSYTYDKTYLYGAGTGYGEEAGSVTVHANHYGASELRSTMQKMLINGENIVTTYFSVAEQSLMQETTVQTYDTNNDVNYTTTDVLYALYGYKGDEEKIWAGSGNSKLLKSNIYWNNGDRFWLRCPYLEGNYDAEAYYVHPSFPVVASWDVRGVNNNLAVRPATNLNVTDVLFASSVPHPVNVSETVSSGSIESNTAMILRMDATGQNIGTVVCDSQSGIILSRPGGTEPSVFLIVQGNDGTNDWYYSKSITEKEILNVSTIKEELQLTDNPDLSKCKVWLETMGDDGLIYAENAVEDTVNEVSFIAITDVSAPVAGVALDTEASTSTQGIEETVPSISWSTNEEMVTGDADYHTVYTATIIVNTTANAYFSDTVSATVNSYLVDEVIFNESGSAVITYTFPVTEKVINLSDFATKNELMSAFLPSGENAAVGKLVLGKDVKGNILEWYILGKDDTVVGDNISIFAAGPLITGQQFEGEYGENKTFLQEYGMYESSPSQVYCNHYGASDCRRILQGLAMNEECFTRAEQKLMQPTVISTADECNSTTFSTSDVLYALKRVPNETGCIQAGGNDDKLLYMVDYWPSGKGFWLRTAHADDCAQGATPEYGTGASHVSTTSAIRPASNIDLSSVLFASSVPNISLAAELEDYGIIENNTAMILRLKTDEQKIGSVVCDTEKGIVLAEKGRNAQKVFFVMQGNDQTKDWYYSKEIIEKEIIDIETIKDALGLLQVPDLSDCQMWLETTGEDGMVYATMGDESVILQLGQVALTGIDIPVAGTPLDVGASTDEQGISDSSPVIRWMADGKFVAGNAAYDTVYTASISMNSTSDAYFEESIMVTVNGEKAEKDENSLSTLVVSYTFPATEKEIVQDATSSGLPADDNETKDDTEDISMVDEHVEMMNIPIVGQKITSEDGSATYKVTETGENGNSVTYEAPTDKNQETVVVPATVTINNITYNVTTISDTAFAGNKKLTSVTIGDNVTGFSAKTFKGCSNLKTLIIGNGVTSIPANAFKNFKKLTTVKMGTGVKTIGKNAFYGCKKLKNLTLGKNVVTIGDKAFYKCTSLTKLTIPSKVKTIGKSAFYGCKALKTITIGKSVTKIGSKAFYGCSKTKTLTIKSSKLTTKKIGSKAFSKTPKSMKVTIPKKKFKTYKSMLIKRGVNKKAKFKKS